MKTSRSLAWGTTTAVLYLHAAISSAALLKDDFALARGFQQTGDLVRARAAYQSALHTAKERRDESAWAGALLGLAQVDLTQGHYAECVRESSDAVTHYRALRDPHPADRSQEGLALTTLGQARYFSGDSQGALRDFDSALTVARSLRDRQAEVGRLNNMGSVYFALGRYGEAFARYQAAREEVNAATAEPWFASRNQLTNANLAVLYQGLGEYERALQIYQQMGADPKALPPAERAQMLANMGTLYRRLGDPVTALERYKAAQELYKTNALTSGELAVLNNIGIDYALDLRNPTAAIDVFTRALEISARSDAKRFGMTSLLYRGETLLRAGESSKASLDFEESRRIATILNADEEKWRASYGLARTAAAQGDLKRSDTLLQEAIDIIERMRKSSSKAFGRSGFLIERRDVYDLLIEHKASAGDADVSDIFRLMELSRARDLQDKLGTRILSLGELTQRLPSDTLLVEYWLGTGSIISVSVARGKAHLSCQPLTGPALSALVALPGILNDTHRADWRTKLQDTSKLLLGDVTDFRDASLRRLLIVPDGDLARIPFEALPHGNGLLIDRMSVAYLPFGSALGAANHPASVRRWQAPWSTTMVGFANPAPGSSGSGLKLGSELPSALPNATREVRMISDSLDGRTDLYIGREARKRSLLRSYAAPVPILHFATHAFADPENPERSYVLFAGERQGFDYLFLREASEVAAARGALVTVSACDSGAGRLARGEGIQSFGPAFLAAGAGAVITSLWRVGDSPSAELMSRFYARFARGETVTEALRNAKLEFRHSPGSAAHPAYWAAFVLTGDGSMRMPRVVSWAEIATVAALLFAVALAGIIRLRKRAGKV